MSPVPVAPEIRTRKSSLYSRRRRRRRSFSRFCLVFALHCGARHVTELVAIVAEKLYRRAKHSNLFIVLYHHPPPRPPLLFCDSPFVGFLPALDGMSRGNFGLMDQVAALHWIQENIAEFGGDPKSVTVLGHSTGAACVNMLMLSPMSKGWYGRADVH